MSERTYVYLHRGLNEKYIYPPFRTTLPLILVKTFQIRYENLPYFLLAVCKLQSNYYLKSDL
jgi:hypothetical protein